MNHIQRLIAYIKGLYFQLFPKHGWLIYFTKAFFIAKTITFLAFMLFIFLIFVGMLYLVAMYRPIDLHANPDPKISSNQYFAVQKVKDTFIIIQGKNCESYKVTLRESKVLYEQPFDKQKYTRNQVDAKTNDNKKIDKICNNVENLNNGLPLSVLLNNEPDLSAKILTAMNAMLYEVSKTSSELHIFVKGYADRSNEQWKKPLDKNFHYEEIEYYPAITADKRTYIISPDSQIKYLIPSEYELGKGFYGNSDLPLLRAKYVVENQLKNNLAGCFPTNTSIGVLEGEILDAELPDARNTEIYVTACD